VPDLSAHRTGITYDPNGRRLAMQLEGIGVTQRDKRGPFQLRLKFGPRAYCVVEIRRGEDAADVAAR
jgi:hypothetical protein